MRARPRAHLWRGRQAALLVGLVARVGRPVRRAARSVFAGQHQGALVEVELNFIERKVGRSEEHTSELQSL